MQHCIKRHYPKLIIMYLISRSHFAISAVIFHLFPHIFFLGHDIPDSMIGSVTFQAKMRVTLPTERNLFPVGDS